MKLSSFLVPCGIGTLVLAYHPAEAQTLITFDDLNDGDSVSTNYAGLVFSNTSILSSGISLNELEYPPFSGSNVAADSSGAISIDFASPVSEVSGRFTYSVPLTLTAFDSSNALILTQTSAFASNVVSSGNPANELLSILGLGNIARITITGSASGGSFVLDNLQYVGSAPVPEPSAIALFSIGGTSLAVWLLRRKRK